MTSGVPAAAAASEAGEAFRRAPAPAAPRAPYYEQGGITILNEDFLATEAIPPESVDLIVTSPPYNVDVAYGGYRDDLPYPEYLAFSARWLAKALALARPRGRLCLNVPLDKNKGGMQAVSSDLTGLAQRAGWRYQSTIIWNEQNISRRTAWGSWMSPSAPFVIAPVEVVIVLSKGAWARRERDRVGDITREEFLDWTNAVWTFGGERGSRVGHPAPFPVELPRRCLKLFSYVGDTVLDPFLGSGSTLLACREGARRGIGVELDPRYCALARDRLEPAAGRPRSLEGYGALPIRPAPAAAAPRRPRHSAPARGRRA
jgi:site-specific DNA-methyltransferase (adenine-specific)